MQVWRDAGRRSVEGYRHGGEMQRGAGVEYIWKCGGMQVWRGAAVEGCRCEGRSVEDAGGRSVEGCRCRGRSVEGCRCGGVQVWRVAGVEVRVWRDVVGVQV